MAMASTARPASPLSLRTLLLVGAPGVGKTTVIRTLLGSLHVPARGLITEEVHAEPGHERVGYLAYSLDGHSVALAHVDWTHKERVGRYGVDVAALDRLAYSALAPDPRAQVYLIDEIGKMTCFSHVFTRAVTDLVDGGYLVVATVPDQGSGLIAEIKRRPDVELWEVAHEERDDLPDRILDWLEARGAGRPARPPRERADEHPQHAGM